MLPAPNRQVCKGVKLREGHPKSVHQLALVVGLKCILRRGQGGALRVVHEAQFTGAIVEPVTQCIQALQPTYARPKDAFSALRGDILLGIARQRRNDFHVVVGEKLGQVLLPRLLQHRQIATVHDVDAKGPCLLNQRPEIAVQLGRPAVKSSVATSALCAYSSTRSTVSAVICSVRVGPAFT